MRALTLIQPMASAIVIAHPCAKRTENRPRPLPKHMQGHATVIAVHAGLGWSETYADLVRRLLGNAIDWDRIVDYPGCIVGLMRLTGRQFTIGNPPKEDPWWSGPYGYEISTAIALPDPVPCRSGFHRGWWTVPNDVASHVLDHHLPPELRP